MKAVIVKEPGKGVGAWDFVEKPSPSAGAGCVKIRIRAVSLNYRDLMVAKGTYGGSIHPGLIPLSDGAGEIVELGEGVSGWKIGDRVMSSFFQTWIDGPVQSHHQKHALGGTIEGVFAEEVVLNANAILPIPDYLSLEEASTLPCAALTAWNALMETNQRLPPGSTILTQGTGGVSTFALLFAKAAGYRVISTSSSDEKLAKLEQLGADALINYKAHEAWDKEVWRLTDGRGVDQVIEVGGADTLPLSFKSSRAGATISVIGVLTGMNHSLNPAPILQRSLRVQGIYVGSVAMFRRMLRAMELHQIRPVIDEIFPFARAKEALRKIDSSSHFGKIVVRL